MIHSKPTSPLSAIKSSGVPSTIQCKASAFSVSNDDNTSRRGENHFQPTVWDYDYIQSIRIDFSDESYKQERDKLKEEVRVMLLKLRKPVEQLELIEDMQRLGVAYHYGHEMENIMEEIYNNDTLTTSDNLYATALKFRLLRQHGFHVSTEMIAGFLDDNGHFHSCLSCDVKGLLYLYEASFLSNEGEMILDKAREFSSTHLKEFVNKKSSEEDELSLMVSRALGLPLDWRISRLETLGFIPIYERRLNKSSALLKLAKLDYNILQATLQEDIKYLSRWWKRNGLGEKLSFARDRMVENFIWSIGLTFEPQHGNFRRVMTKVGAIITVIDDVYDIYGTLEELKLFTEVVERWEVNALDALPDYMKICFLALYNFVNEVAFDFLKENGRNIIPHLQKGWAGLCKAYLVEAEWYHSDYKASFHEYLENAWITIATPIILLNSYFALPDSTNTDDSILFKEYSNVIRYTSNITRLSNDLGTYKREKETGDIPKAVECYMNEIGASEADARRHIYSLICEDWKKLNKEASNTSYNSLNFIQVAVNFVRMSLCMYRHGDAHSIQDEVAKNLVIPLLFQPIT